MQQQTQQQLADVLSLRSDISAAEKAALAAYVLGELTKSPADNIMGEGTIWAQLTAATTRQPQDGHKMASMCNEAMKDDGHCSPMDAMQQW